MTVVFALLFPNAGSVSCDKTITVRTTTPIRVSTLLAEGEQLCVNSELPFLTVVFSFSTLLSVRYRINGTSERGSLIVPGEAGGIDFGRSVGSLQIESLMDGRVDFTFFAFPERCSSSRYVTNLDPDVFTLREKFGEEQKGPVCLWYTERSFVLSLREVPKTDGSVSVCREDVCQGLEKGATRFSNADFFIVETGDIQFLSNVRLDFHARKVRAPLKVSEVLRGNRPVVIRLADELWANRPAARIVPKIPGSDEGENGIMFAGFLALAIVLTALATLAISYYCLPRKQNERQQSETEFLIGTHDPRRFPQYIYPYGYPVTTGVYFPPAPDSVI
jgi:hypothetical protein